MFLFAQKDAEDAPEKYTVASDPGLVQLGKGLYKNETAEWIGYNATLLANQLRAFQV